MRADRDATSRDLAAISAITVNITADANASAPRGPIHSTRNPFVNAPIGPEPMNANE